MKNVALFVLWIGIWFLALGGVYVFIETYVVAPWWNYAAKWVAPIVIAAGMFALKGKA